VPARYADYLAKASKIGDETAFRHYWEMYTRAGPAGRAAVGRCVRARLPPLRRPGHLPVHPGAVAATPGGVLSAGPQTVRGARGHRPGEGPPVVSSEKTTLPADSAAQDRAK